jgi:transcriptional regulator of aromatic amino acid metabolism
MHSTDFVQVSDLVLLQWLTLRELRPNLLVTCGHVEIEAITKHLMAFCAPPFHVCPMGTLRLPSAARGTLFIEGVAELTLRQQILLNDWISAAHDRVQIVSLTSAPLWPLVENGEFLEGLFFRLNVVCLEARSTADGHSTSPEDPEIFDLDAVDWELFSRRPPARRGPRRNQS